MSCPDDDFLNLFVQDPDAALESLPEFMEHLGECGSCRKRIDVIGNTGQDRLVSQVLGELPDPLTQVPEIAGYQILEQAVTGGHGSVYRARQLSTGRQVAIKFTYQVNYSFAKRVETERNALIRADHPHIVALLDAGHLPNGYYFVYRWMDSNLSAWIKSQEAVPIRRALEIIHEVAEAVEHLHSIGILHRDIKPSNVLLDAKGQTKLTDFGIAKELSQDQPSSTTTLPVGTPGYMAPEQTGLVPDGVSFQTDVYGLGALFYALLTGRPPFLGGNNMQTVQQVVSDDPLPPRRLRVDIPADCETICLKCLNKRKEDRYLSVKELIDDLQRLRRHEPIRAKPASRITKARHWFRRHPRTQSMAWTSLVMLLAGLSVVWWIRSERKAADEKLTAYTLIEKLKSCNSGELPSVLEAIHQLEASRLRESIVQTSIESPVQQLRIWMVSPELIDLTLEEILAGVVACELRDLPSIHRTIQRLLSQKLLDIQALEELWNRHSEPENLLKIASILPVEMLGGVMPANSAEVILEALSMLPEAESLIWSQALLDYSSDITNSLIQRLDESTIEDRNRLNTVVATALQWNVNDPTMTLEILTRATIGQLSNAKRESAIYNQVLLQFARDRWSKFRELGGPLTVLGVPSPHAADSVPGASPDIKLLLSSFMGLATHQAGFLLRVPAGHLNDTLSTLQEFGFSVTGFQPYNVEMEKHYTLTFQASAAGCSFTEDCAAKELDTLVKKMKSEGWEPVAIWPDSELESVSILWQSMGRINGNISWPRKDLFDWEVRMHEGFSSGMNRILTAYHSYTKGAIGINLQWFNHETKPDNPQMPLAGLPQLQKSVRTQIELEDRVIFRHAMHSESSVSQLTIQPCSQEDFLLRATTWMSQSIEPRGVSVDPSGIRFGGFWELNHSRLEGIHRAGAMCALICWLCGDMQPVIEELESRPFPTSRTLVMHGFHEIEPNPGRWLSLAEHLRTPDQLYAWLVAGSNYQWQFANRSLREETVSRLNPLREHEDAAVGLTARWLLRERLQDEPLAPEPTATPPSSHRNWFYSPAGIPFIVINTSDVHLISNDNRLPGNTDSIGNAVQLPRVIAMSAIEIPKELFEQYLESNPNWRLSQSQVISGETATPVLGIDYINTLRFCRWLSEREGIAVSDIDLPLIETNLTAGSATIETVWPEEGLNSDGYRLPTGIEWEIACRCGSISSSFLGESDEYLSRHAWNTNNTRLLPMPVGKLAPNPWGLFDPLGNVYEMTLGSSLNYFSEVARNAPLDYGIKEKMSINVRGGSFLSNRAYCVAGSRHGIQATSNDRNTGFRIVRTLKPADSQED